MNKIKPGSKHAILEKLIFSNSFTENIYYSLRFSLSVQFRRLFMFVSSKRKRISKIFMYDCGLNRKFVFFLPYRSRFGVIHMFCRLNYLRYLDEIKETLMSHKEDKICVLDLGANVGLFSIYYYYLLKNVKIDPHLFLFEPLPYNLEFLQRNLTKNNVTEYDIFPGAVCATAEDCLDLFVGGSYTGCTIMEGEKYVVEQATDRIRVKGIKIDDLEINNVGLVKIDIEGAEELALKGMQKTIERNGPIVICSYEHRMNNRAAIIEYLKSCGDYGYREDRDNELLYFFRAEKERAGRL